MKIFGIEFAPLRIPFERRLQTAAVFYYCVNFLFLGFIYIGLCILLLFTDYYFIPLLYLAWFIYDRNICNQGGRISKFYRSRNLWKYMRDYFPVTLVKTSDIDPKKNYIFCCHPHGILCFGAFCCFATDALDFQKVFPGLTPHILTLEGQFWFPFRREYTLATGACAASREGIEWLLTKEDQGQALALIVGGAAESLNAHPGTATLVLNRRKGFVRLALMHGASLVPVFVFGENDLYNQVKNPEGSLLRTIQNRLTKMLGFAPPIILGRGIFQYSFGILPYRKPVTVVVGKPLDLEKIPHPTKEDVNKTHALYVEKLKELFEEHKVKYAPDVKLIIT